MKKTLLHTAYFTLLITVFSFVLLVPGYCNPAFDEFIKVLTNNKYRNKLPALEEKYHGKDISGKGFFHYYAIGDEANTTIVHLTTDVDPLADESVQFAIYLEKVRGDKIKKWKKGRKTGFDGHFDEIRMGVMIIRDATVR